MTKFRNELPITSAWKAICLLHRDWGDGSVRVLTTFPGREPTIDVNHFSGPYDSLSRTDYFQVSPQVAQYIKDEHLVIGKPQWGYRSSFTFVTTDELEAAYNNTIAPKFPSSVWEFS